MKWTSVEIFARLVRRFNLQAYPISPDETVGLQETIQPVTQVDDLLREGKVDTEAVDISGAGRVTAFTVPQGKRWKLLWLWKEATTAVTEIRVFDGVVGIIVILSSTTAASKDMGSKVMEEGWSIDASGTGNGADNARSINIWYEEEDAFRE